MTTRSAQMLGFTVLSLLMLALSLHSLQDMAEPWFFVMVLGRLALALCSIICVIYLRGSKGRTLPLSAFCMAFLTIALFESVLAFLQASVTDFSYALVCMSLVLAAANNCLDLPTSMLAFLPSQILILVAPMLALPAATWSNRVTLTSNLVLPVATLIGSTFIWIISAIRFERKQIRFQVKVMSRAQDLLNTQLNQLKREAEPVVDLHAEPILTEAQVSEQYNYDELIEIVEQGVTSLRDSYAARSLKKAPRIELQVPAQLSIPVRVSMAKADFAMVYASLLKRSLLSLNGETGLIRVSVRVALQKVIVSIEDNGWGFREKFLQIKSAEKASAQASEVGISLLEAQALLQFWGGRLEVLSRLGVGSRVGLELARVDAFSQETSINEMTGEPLNHEAEIEAAAISQQSH